MQAGILSCGQIIDRQGRLRESRTNFPSMLASPKVNNNKPVKNKEKEKGHQTRQSKKEQG